MKIAFKKRSALLLLVLLHAVLQSAQKSAGSGYSISPFCIVAIAALGSSVVREWKKIGNTAPDNAISISVEETVELGKLFFQDNQSPSEHCSVSSTAVAPVSPVVHEGSKGAIRSIALHRTVSTTATRITSDLALPHTDGTRDQLVKSGTQAEKLKELSPRVCQSSSDGIDSHSGTICDDESSSQVALQPISNVVAETTEEDFLFAFFQGNIAMLRQFLQTGFKPDSAMCTLWEVAAERSDDDSKDLNEAGKVTILYRAVESQRFANKRALIEKYVYRYELEKFFGPIYKFDIAVIQLLLQYGADVNLQMGNDGNTPFWRAAGNCDTNILDLLFKRGANVNQCNGVGETTLAAAVKNYPAPQCKKASRSDQMKTVKWLIGHNADINLSEKKGKTPLGCAFWDNHNEESKSGIDRPITKYLLQCKADINKASNSSGETCLMQQVGEKYGYSGKVSKIIAANADIDQRDQNGNTALARLVYSERLWHEDVWGSSYRTRDRKEEHNKILLLLLRSTADINVTSELGVNPFSYVVAKDQELQARLLLLSGGKFPKNFTDSSCYCILRKWCQANEEDFTKKVLHKVYFNPINALLDGSKSEGCLPVELISLILAFLPIDICPKSWEIIGACKVWESQISGLSEH